MLADAAAEAPMAVLVKDLVALAKPRLSLLVFLTTGVGMYLAPGSLGWGRGVVCLLATALVVGAANALNCYAERDVDALMHRTRSRPLPARRMEPRVALLFGVALAVVSVVALVLAANVLTGLFAAVATLLYLGVYTPLKRRTWFAVIVGAVPGAIPPLMGWTAVTGRIDPGAWALFALLFAWQLPHFLAISLYLAEDYARGGLPVLSVAYGPGMARRATVLTAMAFVPMSFLPVYTGTMGWGYALAAGICGVYFVVLACGSLHRSDARRWARAVFLGSIKCLSFLLLASVLEAWARGVF